MPCNPLNLESYFAFASPAAVGYVPMPGTTKHGVPSTGYGNVEESLARPAGRSPRLPGCQAARLRKEGIGEAERLSILIDIGIDIDIVIDVMHKEDKEFSTIIR